MRNDEKILAALLSCGSVRQASKSCGISEGRIYARLRDQEFRKRYDDARLELLEQCAYALQASIQGAITTMLEVKDNPKSAAQVKLNAAEAIVRTGLKLTELTELIRRVQRLEEAIHVD